MKLDIAARIRAQLEKLRKHLKDPSQPIFNGKPLMKQLGALGVAASQKAFRDQKLGDIQWEARYPTQETPKFNIAGALTDWKGGRSNPKPNRFQDRPALIDEGQRGGMWGSLTFEVSGPLSVSWGTNKPYARLHQEGGQVSIRYDEATRDRIRQWLYKAPPSGQKKKVEREKLRTNVVRTGLGERRTRNEYAKHVRPLLHSNVWTQRIIARPFVGVTGELERDMGRAIDYYFRKIQGA